MLRHARSRPAGSAVPTLAWALAALLAPGLPAAEPEPGAAPAANADALRARGAELFASVCADCHGANGEGVEYLYDTPLHGDLSVDKLAELISDTMPEEDPASVVGEDAAAVAAYAVEAFYSRAAQLRNAPPRVELSRLTESQYRRSAAHLGMTFTGERGVKPDEARGLDAEYRTRRGPWEKRLAFKRVDPTANLSLGPGVPAPNDGDERGPADGKLAEEGFQIFWKGAVLPPVTGTYTFTVHCTNVCGLKVNGRQLVDTQVRSGDDVRHSADIFLLGGTPVPVDLYVEKRMGERFGKELKESDFAAKLLWTVPHRAEEVVPARHLLPGWFPEALIVSTPFPPDDKSVGYERGAAVSAAWDEATSEAAFEVADRLLEDENSVRTFLKIQPKDPPDKQREKARTFCKTFAERAFRRPLTDEQVAAYVDAGFADDAPWRDAVKVCVLKTLKSPWFLYPNLHAAIAAGRGEAPDGYDRAASLALSLWDGLPDEWLLKAAEKGELSDPKNVAFQAGRLAEDYKATVKLGEFFAGWLIPEGADEMAKDEGLFPGFDHAAAGDLRTSLELTIGDALAAEKADFRALWNADALYLNHRLAEFYADDLVDPSAVPADGTFARLAVKPGRRAGLLTHPLLMAGYAHHRVTSPIHRGVFVARKLLGRSLKPPKEAFSLLPENFGAEMTTRERISHQTGDTACLACHKIINPLGFSLEQFDAIGRFRTEEKTPAAVRPVDASAVYETPDGRTVELSGAADLSRFVADDPAAHAAFVERLFHAAAKQPVAAYGPDVREELAATFAAGGYDIRAAFAAAAAVAALGPATSTPADARTASADGGDSKN